MPKNRKGQIKKLDRLAREIVLKRDNNTCQKCGKYVEKQNAHISHVVPKSKGYALRWDLNNLKVLCFHCHINWWHKNPIEAAEWFQEKFPERAEYLYDHRYDLIDSHERDEFIEKKIEEFENLL